MLDMPSRVRFCFVLGCVSNLGLKLFLWVTRCSMLKGFIQSLIFVHILVPQLLLKPLENVILL